MTPLVYLNRSIPEPCPSWCLYCKLKLTGNKRILVAIFFIDHYSVARWKNPCFHRESFAANAQAWTALCLNLLTRIADELYSPTLR